STTCGTGQCQNTVQSCVGGVPQTCTPGSPSAEVCDGLDNDCDGVVDDGLGSTTCGTTGQCQTTVQNCVGGVPQSCTPGTPSAEICDVIDNDCDGMTDEGCSECIVVNDLTWCYNSVACGEACNAVCASQGMLPVANNAVWLAAQDTVAECQAIGSAFGLDAVSVSNYLYACLEDESGPHSGGGGLYSRLYCSTTSSCPSNHRTNMDQLGVACGPGSRRSICPCEENCGPGTPSAEVCDGIDNDCDGTADDGLGTTTCGTGQCQRTVQNCVGGVQQTCTPGTPSAETCDSIDNDCDGVTDEGCTNCLVVNGLKWCFNPAACGQACNAVCASQGLTPVASNSVWFAAQDTAGECQAIANAFGIGAVSVSGYAFACLEDEFGPHSVGGGLYSRFYCSTMSSCPNSHRTNMDQLGVACGPSSRRSICPCE
ncbi:MAG: MopE-related protein, partial [Candidatus Binatia bacterium]